MNTFDKIYEVASKIPLGKVMTYGQIAQMVNTNPRVVGYAMAANKSPKDVPCHRVIKSDGTLAGGYAFGGRDVKRQLLEDEGIPFVNNIVDLKKHLYSADYPQKNSSQ